MSSDGGQTSVRRRVDGRRALATAKSDFPVCEPRTHITPDRYPPMGYVLPAAIGAKLAKRGASRTWSTALPQNPAAGA